MKIEIFLPLLLFSCNPMDCHTPGFPVFYYLPEFAQTHLDWVYYAIRQSHPLWPNSPSVFSLSQYQSIFQWVDSLHQVTKVSELQLQHESFQRIFRVDFLEDWLVWLSCCSKDSQEFFPALQLKSISTWCSAFFMVQLSYPYMTTGKTIALTRWTFTGKVMSLLYNMLSRLVITFLPKKSQGCSPSEWTGWTSLQSKELSRVFSNTTVQKHQFFSASTLTSIHDHWKNHSLD